MSKFFFICVPFFLGIVFGLPINDHDVNDCLLNNKIKQLNSLFDDGTNEHLVFYPIVLQGKKSAIDDKNLQSINLLPSQDPKSADGAFKNGLSKIQFDTLEEENNQKELSETFGKRNFDEIDRAGFKNFKRNFDEIDRAGFTSFKRNFKNMNQDTAKNVKRNFDEIDRAGFKGFRNKKNFDEIDRAGFNGFRSKRNFYEIDRADLENLKNKKHSDDSEVDMLSF